jgi:hypothetical protein
MIQSLPKLPRDTALNPELPPGQSVKLIGLGGVGSIVARYGATWLASLAKDRDARLVLIDRDTFQLHNATRMLFRQAGNKAAVVRDDLLQYFDESRLTLQAVEEFVTPDNIGRLINEGDIVLAAVDNHATRKLLSDYCASQLDDVVLISGGNDGVGEDSTGRFRRGTFGNCQIFVRREGKDQTPALTQSHPEIANPGDHLPTESCTDLVASVPQILLANLASASAILNTLWLHLCGSLHYHELAFDIAEALMRPLPSRPVD